MFCGYCIVTVWRQVRYLACILYELLPLRLELFAGDDVHLPMLVVVSDDKSSFREVRQNRLDHDDRASRVQLLVCFRLYTRVLEH